MEKSVDFYELLGISIFASQEEIKTAYLNMIKKYHPDAYKGNRKEAENITASINEGYAILSDSGKKALYDKKYGFADQREAILKEKEIQQKKQNKKNKVRAEKKNYSAEKAQKEKIKKQKEFNASTQRKEKKPKTNIFTKQVRKDTKAMHPFATSSEQKQHRNERLAFDIAILVLLAILILLIIFK